MVAKKPPPVVLTGTVVDATPAQLVGLTPARLLDLAAAWESEAGRLEGTAGAAWDDVGGFEDVALALVGGTAAQLRADALRDCARQLRALVARIGGS